MISPKEAIARFSKKYEGLTITNAVDYNDDWYVLTAVESPNETSYSNPYYAVSKKDGTIASFYPAAEIAQYFKAVRERSIDLKTIDREKSMDDDVVEHSFQELTDDFLKHYGTPGMHWRQQGPGKRYQSQAVYAQGRPNPDGKVRGHKEKSEKVNVLSKNDFHNLPQREQIRIQTDSLAGKNYEFNKKMRASLQNEKDGTGGRIDTVSARYGPMQLHWEKSDGRVTFREAAFNRKVSDKYADKMLNQAMFGDYTRQSGVPDAAILNVGKTSKSRRKT